ncbi:MAG: DUF2878 domain-containing protein [Arenimonas sp.]|nr:DUF2878 domain-containing protein [Arenimonas sp.]
MPRPWFSVVANVVGYQLVWMACIAGAGRGMAWLGPVAAMSFVVATLAFGGKRDADLRALALAVPLGVAMDSLFAASGWLNYAQAWPWPQLAPVWIWALWAAFAMTLNHSLAFLEDRPWLAALLGLVCGPLAYSAAAGTFNAVDFGVPLPWIMVALALAWALLLPLLMSLNKRLAPAAGALA